MEGIKKKGILVGCLTFSLVLHISCLYFLQNNGFVQKNVSKSILEQQSKLEKNRYLETVFQNIIEKKSSPINPLDELPSVKFEAKKKITFSAHPLKLAEPLKQPLEMNIAKKEADLLANEQYIASNDLPSSKLKINYSKDDKVYKSIKDSTKNISLSKKNRGNFLPKSTFKKEDEKVNPLDFKTELDKEICHSFPTAKTNSFKGFVPKNLKIDNPTEISLKPIKRQIDIPLKPASFISLPHLNTYNCSDDFDTDIVFLPNDEGDGYIFALTLIPKPYVDFPKIKQNFFFLIDRSNGIGQKRFHTTQSAVLRSLTFLNEEDTFNIIAFDNRVELLSPYNVNYGKEGVVKARQFLDKLSLGNIFTSSNLSYPLYSVLSYPSDDDEINVAILLTNGDGISEMFNNRFVLNEWSLENKGHVSLYSLGLSSDQKIPMMEVFTSFNQGKVLTAKTSTGIKRKLLKLMQSIKHPIAKDVTLSAISKDSLANIELYSHLKPPHLYCNDPYVIMGSVKTLDDFILFVQARRNGGFLNIKKSITFKGAKTADKVLRKQWALQKAYEKYNFFLQTQDPKYLKEVKAILTPYKIDPIFP